MSCLSSLGSVHTLIVNNYQNSSSLFLHIQTQHIALLLSNYATSCRSDFWHSPHHISNQSNYTSFINNLYLGIICSEMALLPSYIVCIKKKQSCNFSILSFVGR